LMAKDLGLALSAGKSVDAPLPLTTASEQLYKLISEQGGGHKDFSSTYQFLNQRKVQVDTAHKHVKSRKGS